MSKLLFIKHSGFNARTVDYDLQILKEKFDVKLCNVNTSKGAGFFIAVIKQFFYLLFNAPRFKVLFIWFADYHSLLPVLFARLYGRYSVINIGGYDADEILHGNPKSLKDKFRKFCVKYSVKNCTKLLPVSTVMKEYLSRVVDENKSSVIYCCIDTKDFKPETDFSHKENLIVTVGGGGGFIKEAKRKRLDLFIELGNEFNKRYPQYGAKFFAVGHNTNHETYKYLSGLIHSPNIELKPMTKSVDELAEYYKRASVYMQMSYYEAFGIAQAEAMFYGCIPVSNAGGAIPEIVGGAGIVIKDYDIEQYISAIKDILDKKHEDLRIKAHERVLQNFTLEARKEKLLKILP